MKTIATFLLVFLVFVSNQRYDIKTIYEVTSPIHEWNGAGSASILKSEKEINSFLFNELKIGVVWNSYEMSKDDDFLISFDYIIDYLTKINTKNENIFQILLSSNLYENGGEPKTMDENLGKTLTDLIGFELDLIKDNVKGIINFSFIKILQGEKIGNSINEIYPFVRASKNKKNNKINIQIQIIDKKLSFKINNKEIIKNDEINTINELLGNQKIFIRLISYGTDKLIINNFKIIKIIKPYTLRYDYKIINNNLNSIKIKIKDKCNKNISINALKNMECYFDKSYIKEGTQKFYFQQFFKDDAIELIPNEKINFIKKNFSFILILKCLNNEKI